MLVGSPWSLLESPAVFLFVVCELRLITRFVANE